MTSKKILIGITGGIAAYKVITLIRLLKKAGAEVQVIVTDAASEFVSTLTLATVSENAVLHRMADASTGLWTNHVALGLWADAFLIAPLSANTLAKMAIGQSDNLLITTYLSSRCPVFVGPAMDLDMWAHPTTKANLATLVGHRVQVIEPTDGPLASGLSGKGRMEEPENLFTVLESYFSNGAELKGKRALVTLGPTVEAIDPVRFISNHSTGKMGIEIAKALLAKGAEVQVVAGPVLFDWNTMQATVQKVTTAEEMYQAVHQHFADADVVILTAAVADYTPATVSSQKIKKSGTEMNLELVKTKDIAASLGAIKKPGQLLIGFALETENEQPNAHKKLETKKLDAIVLNSMNDAGAGFGHDTNKITIFNTKGETFTFETKSKKEVAVDLANYVVKHLPGA